MAQKKFDMTIDINAKTAQAVAGIGKVDASLKTLVSQTRKVDNTFKALASVVGSFYLVSKGIDAARAAFGAFTTTASRFEQLEDRMGAFTTSTSHMKAEMARAREFAQGFNQDIASVTETMIMMKNYGLDASNESLQVYTNTAIGAGKDVKQFAEAMADALQGENERLTEFGIKAAQQGDKIKYHWTDSIGQVRDIVIDNNNKIIDSTLRAIFNEKYAGQSEAFKNSWAGQVQGMKNTWTQFKLAMMEGGLFDYLKSAAGVAGDYVKSMFSDGAKGAKEWSGIIISGIESTIIGVGNMIDAWNGIKLTFTSIKAVFYATVAGIGDGINWIADAYESLKVSISNSFKAAMDAVGKAAYGAVNYILEQISNFVNSISGALGGVFEYLGQDNPFGTINLSIGEYTSSIDTATKSTEKLIDTTWAETGLKEALQDADSLVDALANESGKNGALKIISDIHDKLKDVTKETKAGNDEKEAARKKLEEIIAANANNTLETKKSTDASKSNANAVKNAAKEYAKLAEQAKGYYDDLTLTDKQKALNDLKDKVAQIEKYMGHSKALEAYENGLKKINGEAKSLTQTLQEWMGLDNDSLFANIFSGFTDAMGSIGDALRSGGGIGDAIGSLFTKSLDFIMPGLSGLVSLVGGLFSDVVSQAEIDAATGRSDFSDESIKKMGDEFSKALNPQLDATYTMSKYLRSMNNNFEYIAKAIVGSIGANGIDLTGAGYVPTSESGFLGFSSKSIELLGSGLNMGGSIGDIVVSAYISELVTKSSWFGLKKSSYTSIKNIALPASTQQAFMDIMSDGVAQILVAGTALGFDENAVKSAIEAYNISIGRLDLKGLSQTEANERVQAAISEIFSGAIDTVDGLNDLVNKYQKLNEESLGTLTRIATEYEQASYALGTAGIQFSDTDNGYETIYTEVERTLVTYEQTWYEAMYRLNSASERVVKTYTEIVETQVRDIYTAEEKVLDIVKAFDGLDNFNDSYNSYVTNFFSDSEKLQMTADGLSQAFSNLGVAMPHTKEEYRALIDSASQFTSEAGAEAFAQLLKLGDAFADFAEKTAEVNARNIKAYEDMFKTQEQIVTDMANALGVSTAYSYDALNVMFEQLKSDVDGLTDADLELLNANKAYLEQLDEEAEAKRQATIDDYASQINSLNDALSALTGSVSKNISDVTSLIDAVGRSISSVDDAIAGYINAPTTLSDVTSGLDSFSALSGSEKYAMSDDMIALVGDYYNDVKQQIEDEYDAKIAAISAEQAAAEAAAQARYDALKQEADAINSINDQIKSLQDYANSLILNNTSLDPVQSINMWAAQFTDVMGDLRGAISANNVDDTSMYAGMAKDYSGNYIDAAKIGASTRADYEMIVAGVANDLNGLGLKTTITLGDVNATLESIRTTYATKIDELNVEQSAAIDRLTTESIGYLEIVKSQLDEEKLQLETIDATLRDSFPELYEPVANIETTLRRLDDKTLSMEEVQQNIIDTRTHQQNLENLISELNAKIDSLNSTTEKVAQNTDTSTDNLFTQGVA